MAADLKTVGWSATVLGVLQLLQNYSTFGTDWYLNYILAVLVVVVGLWAALGK